MPGGNTSHPGKPRAHSNDLGNPQVRPNGGTYAGDMPDSSVLSIVVPMYNEEDVLPLLVARLRPTADALVADALATAYEVVAVDDGSTDATPVLLQRLTRQWPQLRVIRLRANAGHQAAISAGLARAVGDYVVTIDADLQDPPEAIRNMLTAATSDGLDVVYGVRNDRSTDSRFKRWSSGAFYRTQRALSKVDAPIDAGDFRLMSRATVDAVNALPEHHRVLRFVVPALGFPSGTVSYRRDERAAGDSKYPLTKMLLLSVDSMTGFSLAPLRFATWLGLLGGLAAVVILLYAVGAQWAGATLPGWTSTIVIVAAVGAVQLLALGILGEYVGRMYAAIQGRPTYYIAYDSQEAGHGSTPTVAGSTAPVSGSAASDTPAAPPPAPAGTSTADLTVPLDNPLGRR